MAMNLQTIQRMRLLRIAALSTVLLVFLAELSSASSRPPVTFGSVGRPINYVVMGDSTAAGVGADYEQGIAISTAKHLGERYVVTMTNFGVSGARMHDVREQQLPLAASLRPDMVLLSAGANDVTHLTGIGAMRDDLRAIVKSLREANSEVRIVITGSPDMGSPPRIPRILRGLASWRTKRANRMFIAEAARLGLVFAPIAEGTGPLFRRDRSLFAEDLFHPNNRGYATWVGLLNEALISALRRGQPSPTGASSSRSAVRLSRAASYNDELPRITTSID